MTKAPESYADVARLRGQEVLLYTMFGSYQGEWMLLAFGDPFYILYTGLYGSCSGCDDIEVRFHYDGEHADEVLAAFLANYTPFAEIPRETARNLVTAGILSQVVPRNTRSYWDEENLNIDQWTKEAEFIIKLRENLPITTEEILTVRNQESRRQAIERRNISTFMDDVDGVVLDTDERGDRLMKLSNDLRYLWLKDGSTDREYVLRVPDDAGSVLEGKAWSFDLPPDQYTPILET